jgi:peptidoglycan/LPS O-acetylase OafA/YrhL
VIGKNQHIAWAAIEQLEIKTLQYPAITEFTVHAGALRIPFVSLDAALYTVIHARPDIVRMAPNTVMALARYVLLVLGIGGGLLIASSSDTVQTLIGGGLLIPMLGMLIAHLWQRNTTAPRRLERVLGGIGLALVGIMVVIAAAYGILQEDGFQIGEILFLLVMGSGLLRLGYVLARNPGGVDQLVKQVDTTLEKYGPN